MTPREILIEYLKMKVDQCDWHGCSDAANDLRVLEAEEANLLNAKAKWSSQAAVAMGKEK